VARVRAALVTKKVTPATSQADAPHSQPRPVAAARPVPARRCNALVTTFAGLRHGHGCIPIETSIATSVTSTTIVT
jgi:hypothetical protein